MNDKIDYSTRYKFLVSAGIALVLLPEAFGVFLFTYDYSNISMTCMQIIILIILGITLLSGFILGLKWIRDGLLAWKVPEEENLMNLKLANKAQEVAIEIEKNKLNNSEISDKRRREIEELSVSVAGNNTVNLSIIEDYICKNLIKYNTNTHQIISQCIIQTTPFDVIAASLLPGIADFIIEVIHIESALQNKSWIIERIEEMEKRRKALFDCYEILAAWRLVLVTKDEYFSLTYSFIESTKNELPSASKIDVIPFDIYESYAPILYSGVIN